MYIPYIPYAYPLSTRGRVGTRSIVPLPGMLQTIAYRTAWSKRAQIHTHTHTTNNNNKQQQTTTKQNKNGTKQNKAKQNKIEQNNNKTRQDKPNLTKTEHQKKYSHLSLGAVQSMQNLKISKKAAKSVYSRFNNVQGGRNKRNNKKL